MAVSEPPVLVWIRRDLRLGDHPALSAAAATGRPVVPVFLHDEVVETLGAAPAWRLGQAVRAFSESLARIGSGLVLRRGRAAETLLALVAETGASTVLWQRTYDPAGIARDTEVKAVLEARGVEARSLPGLLLFEPWNVAPAAGGYFKVFTPFWKAVRNRDPGAPLAPMAALRPPRTRPVSDDLDTWALGAAMRRGARVVARHTRAGEAAAAERLAAFAARELAQYADSRDLLALDGTSGLSDHLAVGEISIRQCWHAGMTALESGNPGAETFLKQLCWREFAWALLFHTPHIASRNWRPEWDGFAWSTDADAAGLRAWQRGRTGVALVDAAMRQMHVTGRMHNRARMIAASYLTKHLLTDWRLGLAWFQDHLTDWDPASNALGWQWVAGSGPDAAPYFRIFNPDTQAARFDPDGAYRRRWLAEGQARPPETALEFYDACPPSWGLGASDVPSRPLLTLAEGRARALAAFRDHRATTGRISG